jgi:hypothetical protein
MKYKCIPLWKDHHEILPELFEAEELMSCARDFSYPDDDSKFKTEEDMLEYWGRYGRDGGLLGILIRESEYNWMLQQRYNKKVDEMIDD